MTEQVESLWGKLDLKEMGIRASREPAPTKSTKPVKAALARDARSAIEYVTAVVAGALDDQPTAIIDSAPKLWSSLRRTGIPAVTSRSEASTADA